MKKHDLGIVFSGGGIKGAAELGVLKAMEENDIKAGCVAGASSGAVVAALYAYGYSSEEILKIFEETELLTFKYFSWSKPGLMDTEKYKTILGPYFKNATFETLDKELYVVATDLILGKSVVFHSGEVLLPVLASCAFPLMFSPIEIGNSLYSDGGIINNFPVETIVDKAKYILGIHVSPLQELDKTQLKKTYQVLNRVYRISNRFSSLEKFDKCTWVINPLELQRYGTFSSQSSKEVFDIGYAHGITIIPKIRKALSD